MDCRRTCWPTYDWCTSPPEEQGMDASLLEQAHAYASTSAPPMHALLVVRHGCIVLERYYRGFSARSYHSVNSVTKSIVSALVGIALRDGHLSGLRQPVVSLLPERLRRASNPLVGTITVEDLLRMTGGFGVASVHKDPFLDPALLETALAGMPRRGFHYDELTAHVASVVLTHVTGMDTAAFANCRLFKPLGVWRNGDLEEAHTFHPYGYWHRRFPWKVDSQGYTIGALGAHLTAREMAKLGYLYLNDGNWDGCSIVPSEYVRASCHTQSEGGAPEHTPYGYMWWVTSESGHRAFFAAGYGGQLIYVVPSLDLVVVMTTSSDYGPSTHHRTIVPRFILPAVVS
jgi:CubicO group peptidase (beta-lactamase class C family)